MPPAPADQSDTSRIAIGAMTGTSLDGIDIAIARITGRGLDMTAELIGLEQAGLDDLARDLRALAEQKPMTAGEIARVSREFALAHVRAIRAAMDAIDEEVMPALIALHGQTVFHQPPISWQVMNPWPIAEGFACPVVTDLRGADLAAGGQGAPITPLADWILFRNPNERRAIVNLGGFVNITILPADDHLHSIDDIRGFDLCACNQVLDAVARRALGKPFDEDGQAAQRGSADGDAVKELSHIFATQRAAQRSLGTGDEAGAWVDRFVSRLSPDDLAASAVEALASTILTSVAEHEVSALILAGGGASNRALVNALTGATGVTCRTSAHVGVPIEGREALAMAVLGALAWDGVPITLPQVTGGRAVSHRAGQWCLPPSLVAPL